MMMLLVYVVVIGLVSWVCATGSENRE
jgi:hypothetical protein